MEKTKVNCPSCQKEYDNTCSECGKELCSRVWFDDGCNEWERQTHLEDNKKYCLNCVIPIRRGKEIKETNQDCFIFIGVNKENP